RCTGATPPGPTGRTYSGFRSPAPCAGSRRADGAFRPFAATAALADCSKGPLLTRPHIAEIKPPKLGHDVAECRRERDTSTQDGAAHEIKTGSAASLKKVSRNVKAASPATTIAVALLLSLHPSGADGCRTRRPRASVGSVSSDDGRQDVYQVKSKK